jgi:hypothetical protein
MTSLPVVGGDFDTWGDILNAFLSVALNPDGTINQTALENALNGITVTGPLAITVPTNGEDGIDIQFQQSSTGLALRIRDYLNNIILAIADTGGVKVAGDRIQVTPDIFTGPYLALDGTTNPPSLLWPSATYGQGHRDWSGPGTPTALLISGNAQVNDIWYDSANGQDYVCTVAGPPGTAVWAVYGLTGVNTFNTRSGAVTLQASDMEALYPTTGYIMFGTGTGTAEFINLINAINFLWNGAGYILTGTAANAGIQLAPGAAGTVLTSQGTGQSLHWAAPAITSIPITQETGTTYTLALADAGTQIEFNNSSPVTVTIPTNASAAFGVGTQIFVRQMGAGLVTVSPAGGVTLLSPGGFNTGEQYNTVSLVKDATNQWIFAGTGSGSPQTVPNAPTSVVATPGSAQASLTWTAPTSNGGSAVTGYVVTPFIGTSAGAPISTGSTTTSYTYTGLVNGTGYTFRVAAVNAVGTGPESSASNSVTPTGAALVPVDPNITIPASNLYQLLLEMPTSGPSGTSQVLIAQQMGSQYSGNPTFGYQYDIAPIFAGFTETDAGGTVTVNPTNLWPAVINYDLSFCMQVNSPGYSTVTPNNPSTTGSPRLATPIWAYNGTENGYGTAGSIDGAISQWQAGSLIHLSYHFDNPLTGSDYYDLGNQSGQTGTATVASGSQTTATVTSSGTLNLVSGSTITPSGGHGNVVVPTTSFTVSVTAASSAISTVFGCQTVTVTVGSATNLSVGQQIAPPSGYTGTLFISKVSGTTVTITAWNSPSVPGVITGSTLPSGTYTVSGQAVIQYSGYSSTQLTGCRVLAGGGTLSTTTNAVVPAGNGAMTSSFFSDSTSQAYTNFQDMLATIATFCQNLSSNGSPVIYRPFHEPNGDWFWWGQGGGSGGGGTAAPWYAAAFQYIENYLWNVASPAVHNVLFAWGPCKNNGSTTFPTCDMTSYPGDNAVDIAGIDCYGEDPAPSPTGTGWMKAAQSYIYTSRGWSLSTQKPFAVFEYGWVNVNWSSNGTGNATIYNASTNPSGLWFKYNNEDLLSAFALSTAGTSYKGPAYFMGWGQQWAIRWQLNVDNVYQAANVATRANLVSGNLKNWN